jgi:hypothetical protein
MNTANLQLEGLLLAMAEINRALIRNGVLGVEEIDAALRLAEASATSEERMTQDLSPANRDAVCFPIRLLRLANSKTSTQGELSFSDLAREIGETKLPYNDQR